MISVIIDTSEYQLDDGSLGVLTAHDGWGMSPLHRLSARASQQHGETDKGYRLDPRIGTLVFIFPEEELSGMYDRRATLLSYFSPVNNPKLKWTLPNGLVRQIDVVYFDDMTFPWQVGNWGAQKFVISLKAPDPVFYDPDPTFYSIGAGGGGGAGFVVPMSVPTAVGSSSADVDQVVEYGGTFPEFPQLIRITGPVTNPKLVNETINEKLDFTGAVALGAGEFYEIDLRFVRKTVVDELGANAVSDLTDDSDLSTWRIVPGTNLLNFSGSGITTATKFEILIYDRFVGI